MRGKPIVRHFVALMAAIMFMAAVPALPGLTTDSLGGAGFAVNAEAAVTYYPKCNSKHTSIVDALKSIGVDSSYSNRKKIAQINGISNYTESYAQNTNLLNLLKQGKLIKSKTNDESTLKLNNASIPTSITEGSGFTCTGTITSNYKIKGVSIAIRDAKDNVVTRYDVYPNTYSFNISTIDKYIHFSYAKPGTNYYKIWAQDEKKGVVLLNQAFTVEAKTNTQASSVRQRLDQIMNGKLTYNNSTVMKLGSKFTGYRANEQCKGYAKNVFYLCFKVTPSSTQSKPNNYKLNSTSGMKLVASNGTINATRAKQVFANARPGDFVQIRRTHTGSHSAIVYSVSSTGVTFVEANLDGKNTVYKRTYSWTDLATKNAGMSVYTATSYSLK